MIYLDYAASSPVDEEVLDTFYNISKKYYANPNSNHIMGEQTKKLIDSATEKIANFFNVKSEEIIYTSGASESNNLAIKGVAHRYKSTGKHIIISTLEHNSVVASAASLQEEGFEVDVVPVDKDGLISIVELKRMLRDDTILVSVTSVDSEIGLKQPIEEIGDILKNYPNCHFHTDAAQAIGKVKIEYTNTDLITVAPHKFYGLNSIGILIRKGKTGLKPIINGGKSTTVYRSGTPDTAAIVALSIAVEKIFNNFDNYYNHVLNLHNLIIENLSKYSNVHINNRPSSTPYIINVSIDGIKSNDFVKLLEKDDVIVSAKTSCCPAESPSKLVYALTGNKKLASTSIRISLSHYVTKEEIEKFLDIFAKCLGVIHE